jgi:hypothetical protein
MWETVSISEPEAISTNRAKSFRDARLLPSATLEDIEIDARLIWFVSPNRSSTGNP